MMIAVASLIPTTPMVPGFRSSPTGALMLGTDMLQSDASQRMTTPTSCPGPLLHNGVPPPFVTLLARQLLIELIPRLKNSLKLFGTFAPANSLLMNDRNGLFPDVNVMVLVFVQVAVLPSTVHVDPG